MKLLSKSGIPIFCSCWLLPVNLKMLFARDLPLWSNFFPFLVIFFYFHHSLFLSSPFTWKKPAFIRCTEDALVAFIVDFSQSLNFPKQLCFSGSVSMDLGSLNDLEDTWVISSTPASHISNSCVVCSLLNSTVDQASLMIVSSSISLYTPQIMKMPSRYIQMNSWSFYQNMRKPWCIA